MLGEQIALGGALGHPLLERGLVEVPLRGAGQPTMGVDMEADELGE